MIVIDYKDRVPIYEQIIERVKMLILKNVYHPDDPLPSVRSLAMELSINPNTIQRAYQELERLGFIYSVKGKGCFVNGTSSLIEEQKQKMLNEIKTDIERLVDANVEKEQVMELVEECYRRKENKHD